MERWADTVRWSHLWSPPPVWEHIFTSLSESKRSKFMSSHSPIRVHQFKPITADQGVPSNDCSRMGLPSTKWEWLSHSRYGECSSAVIPLVTGHGSPVIPLVRRRGSPSWHWFRTSEIISALMSTEQAHTVFITPPLLWTDGGAIASRSKQS